MSARSTKPPAASAPVAAQKCHDLLLYLLQRVECFPRSQRFTVGDRLAAVDSSWQSSGANHDR